MFMLGFRCKIFSLSSCCSHVIVHLQIAGSLSDNFNHGFVELLVAYYVVMISVNLSHNLLPKRLVVFFESGSSAGSAVEDRPKLLQADLSIAILVKHIKRDAQVLLIQKTSPVDCGRDELAIVNLAILVRVQLSNQIVPILTTGTHDTKDLLHACLQFFNCEEAILRSINTEEHLLHVYEVGRLHLKRGQQRHDTGLEHILFPERSHVLDDLLRDIGLQLDCRDIVLHPLVIQQLRRGKSPRWVLREALVDELDGLGRQGVLDSAELGNVLDN